MCVCVCVCVYVCVCTCWRVHFCVIHTWGSILPLVIIIQVNYGSGSSM